MEPHTFSIKGYVSVTFPDRKDQMSSNKLWNIISQIWKLYPERISVLFSSKRGASSNEEVENPDVHTIMGDLIGGYIETAELSAATGSSNNLLFGSCFDYRIPFGTRSADVGHGTMIVPVPFLMEGCYLISSDFQGSIKHTRSNKEHYLLDISLEIFMGKIDMQKCNMLISAGHKVFPLKMRCPQYFPAGEDSSETEMTTDASEPEDTETEKDKPSFKRKLPARKVMNRGIIRRSGKSPQKSTKISKKMTRVMADILGGIRDDNLLPSGDARGITPGPSRSQLEAGDAEGQ